MNEELLVIKYLVKELEEYEAKYGKYLKVKQMWIKEKSDSPQLGYGDMVKFFNHHNVDYYKDAPTSTPKAHAMMIRKIAKKLY